MVDIFQEVDEELRKDKYQEQALKWGPWVIGAAATVILGASAWQGWLYWRANQLETASESYIAAMDAYAGGDATAASAEFDRLAAEAPNGYATLALAQRAALALENNDLDQAIAYYDEIAANAADPLVRDLATLKSVWAGWDRASFNDVEIRLSRLAEGGSTYQHLARETIAAAALRDGDLDRARSQYQLISFSLDAPQGVIRRSQEALSLIDAMQANLPADESGLEGEALAAEPENLEAEGTDESGETGND